MPLPTILSGNVASALPTGYTVANSCRFNEAVMHKTPGSEGDTQKMTLSMWVKRSELGVEQQMWHTQNGSNQATTLVFGSNDKLYFIADDSNKLITTRVFRDPSAFMHICLAIDTTQGTAGNRAKLYINGVQETVFDTESQPSEDQNLQWNKTTSHRIGSQADTANNAFNGYLAEVVWIDGTQYAASDFGEFDEDSPTIWKPKDVSGLTFGTNGFYLDFEDSSNLGNDANGGTDLTEVSIAAADQATDTPTNSFCVLNVLNPSFNGTVTEGNCKQVSTSSAWRGIYGTIPFTTGKWYAEFKVIAKGSSGGPGVINIDDGGDTFRFGETNRGLGQGENGVAYLENGQILDGGNTIKTGNTSFTDNDIVGVAIDATNGFVYWHKNGTYMEGAKSGQDAGVPTSGSTGTGGYPLADLVAANGTYLFGYGGDDAWNIEANFGGCSAFTVSSANQDADGYGNFEYAVPSGYYALCTKNLAEYG